MTIFIQMNKNNDMTSGSLFEILFHMERTHRDIGSEFFLLNFVRLI